MRTKIKETIYKAIREQSGYQSIDIKTGFATSINDTQIQLPCAWVCPMNLISRTGRGEGVETYSGVIYMLESIEGVEPEQREVAWERMQRAALASLRAVAEAGQGIYPIETIKCEPELHTLTSLSTISLAVRFELKIKYCEGRN